MTYFEAIRRRALFPRAASVAAYAAALTAGAFMSGATAQESVPETAGTEWPVQGVEAPRTELVLEAYVTIDPAVEVGASDLGTRRFIPITGGRFVGRGLRGRVIPGGADWQLVRPDGVLELEALYALETEDGDVIIVENHGIASEVDTADGDAPRRYLRTSPRFRAPQGEHDWLNKGIFVGTVTPGEGAVVIRVFHVLADGSPAAASGAGPSTSQSPAPAADRAGSRTAARAEGPQQPAAARFPEAAEPEEASYSVTVIEVRPRRRNAVFVTEQGETWVQTDGRRFVAPETPFEAEIEPGALGSYFLVPSSGGRAIRVRRP